LRCQRNIADHAVTGPGARRFMMPAPVEMLRALVESGKLNAEEARLAARVPLATDLTVEADSGGLYRQRAADGRPAHDHQAARRTGRPVWLGTPSSVPAAFALGAAYVLTGSINQSAIESGLSDQGKRMLAEAGIGDVGMAAAADMFELGVKLQVLNRGTMFSVRANKLYELYRDHASLEAIPAVSRGRAGDEDPRRHHRYCLARDGTLLADAIRVRPRRRARTPSTAWRSCSVGISASRAAGPSPERAPRPAAGDGRV
jgi:PfaD family protein